MSLRTLPLRFKLVIALVLPMLLVAVLIGDRVNDSIGDRGLAQSQQDEAARLEVVSAFADAVGAESIITNDPTATSDQLAVARSESDSAFERLQDPSIGLDEDVVRRAGVRQSSLARIREFLGDLPGDIALRFQLEAFIDRAATIGSDGLAESVPRALDRLNTLPTEIIEDFEFDEGAVVDVETTRLLADFDLVQRLRSDYVQEVSAMLQLATTPSALISESAIADFREQLATTDASRDLIFDFGAEELVTDIAAGRRSEAGAAYAKLRVAAERATPGVVPLNDIAAVNSSASVVTSQYADLSAGVVNSIRAQAENTSSSASTSLQLVLIAGALMLLIVALILLVLYRAIRAPLKRLTEQSQHIANVELPFVVAAMRGGELDQAPTTTDLIADADDEIGELVHAFNDMHRTAVELAAEQAGSRRVVADMFVNLGRRNQRLVNRLLKRLTTLERDERDPDKLAGLYEIDHVVTRMRRNAESLLVLAGASQSRKWDRPVEVYDITQAALSEVEGYERVEILDGDDFQIHGDVVADLTHLLAEVVENAVSFSPPSAVVEVSIRHIGDDHLVSVSDLGVGMTETQLAEANARIFRAGVEDETPSEFLGHYVIGRLAARHGIDVRLSTGLEGRGLVADVLIPLGAVVPAAGEIVVLADEATEDVAPQSNESLVSELDIPESMDAVESMDAAETVATLVPIPQPLAPMVPEMALAIDAAIAPVVGPPDWSSAEPEVVRPVSTGFADSLDEQQRRVPATHDSGATPAAASARPSLEYPSADQIDPRQRGVTPRPTAPDLTPTSTPQQGDAPSVGLSAARNSATDAVEGALTAFGSARRTPGAALPDTALMPTLPSQMTIDIDIDLAPTASLPEPASVPLTAPTPDPDEVRFQLSGFQSGTSRADREN